MDEPQRRLSDKIIAAHAQACKEHRADVAELRLEALQVDLTAIGGDHVVEHREADQMIADAFERHESMLKEKG